MTPSPRSAGDVLQEARAREWTGGIREAVMCYEAAIAAAERTGDRPVLAEALRRLAVVRHRRIEPALARNLCARSLAVARELGHDGLAAEALNTLGGLALASGSLQEAREHFLAAVRIGGGSRELGARVEQNLGILANIRGDLDAALAHYQRSLDDYRASNDEHGCALAFHNLGIVSADRGELDCADTYFQQSYAIAKRRSDAHLQGMCLVNHAEVHLARGRYEDARHNAEAALAIFDRLDARSNKAETYRMLGMVYRETGRPALAESRLRAAIDLAVQAGSVLSEAEGSRELAVLYQTMGRNQEALSLLNTAHRLFSRLDARVDLVNVNGKMADLEATYHAVVREWGQSIESNDTYTFGHCERVARHAVAVAEALGMAEDETTTVRLGAYLHDVGKVRVPHEILNKPGPLTREEFAVVQKHPVWGIELLAAVEFPWNLKPIIRWHHERYDGSGYPDRLRGDEIPLPAQVVGIVDVYDALTTDRPYRRGLSRATALAEIERCRGWWSPPVYAAFCTALAAARTAPHPAPTAHVTGAPSPVS
jgi:putative nucleotidyltransferase with HDIG domain